MTAPSINGPKPEPAWREFERVITDLQKAFSPGATISHDERILGQNSGVLRQIDITIRAKLGISDLLGVIDCKKRSRKVTAPDMEAFAGLKEDVRAHFAMIINEQGYSKGALNIVSRKAIQALTFRDTHKQQWAKDIRLDVGMQLDVLVPLKCTFQQDGGDEQTLDKGSVLMDTATGKKFGPADLFNENIFKQGTVKAGKWEASYPARDEHGNNAGVLKLSFQISSDRYFSKVGLEFIGLFDHQSGNVHLSHFKLPPIVLNDIQKNWKRLEPEEPFPQGVPYFLIRTARNGKLEGDKVVADFPPVEMGLKFTMKEGAPLALPISPKS